MATVLDIVAGAMRDIGRLQANEDPPSEDSAAVLEQLNQMMFEWAGDGVDVLHSAFVLADTFVFFVPPADADSDTISAISYQGGWDANANSPTIASATGTEGYVYKVTTAGSTTLDNVTSWLLNDFAVYNGTEWLRGIRSQRFDGGVRAMLAQRVAPEFGTGVPDHIIMRAANAWTAIQAAFIKPPQAGFDVALTRMPSRGLWEGL